MKIHLNFILKLVALQTKTFCFSSMIVSSCVFQVFNVLKLKRYWCKSTASYFQQDKM